MNRSSLHCAIADGIVGAPAYLLNSKVNAALNQKVPGPLPDRAELQRIALDTKTADTLRHSFGVQEGSYNIDDWIELARIPCQFGSLTSLVNINTYLGDDGGRRFGRNVSEIFEYTWVEYHLSYTRIEPTPQRFWNNPYTAAANPGTPLFQLPTWNDNRFEPGLDNEITVPLIPGRSLSLFARIVAAQDIEDFQGWQEGISYVKGDVVVIVPSFEFYVARFDHVSTPALAPGPPANPWNVVADGDGIHLSLWGELQAKVQSEQNLSAKWKAERTYTT